MKTVLEFNQGMTRAMMLGVISLQDDLEDFQKLNLIEDGLPLIPLHAVAYNDIFEAKKKLEHARLMFIQAQLPENIRCSRCDGTGNDFLYMTWRTSYHKCDACYGSGIDISKENQCAG